MSMSMETLTRAWEVLQDAYQARWKATTTVLSSCISRIGASSTARRTPSRLDLSFPGRVEEAIVSASAHRVDPDLGTYNDIGAYLIELGRFEEAIPWLERATEARRYEPRHFPHYNLGRAISERRCTAANALLPGSAGNRAALFPGEAGARIGFALGELKQVISHP